MNIKTPSLILIMTLQGCVLPPPMNATTFTEPPPPTCVGPEDCKAKWDAAQIFVVKHAEMKIQIATDVLIETYNAPGSSTAIAIRITKEPLGGGQYQLVMSAPCGNMFGCGSSRTDLKRLFNATIKAATP